MPICTGLQGDSKGLFEPMNNAKMKKERKKIVKIVVLTKQNIWMVECLLWDLNYWNVDTNE